MGDLDALSARTIEVLQPLIAKPKLTPKLLSKPPFRFLHDVVTNVTKGTGFAEGLYTADELNAGSIKDKDSKLAYLNKIHLYVCAAKGANIPLKTGKVVAGMEPERTNEFLQALAEAASDPSVNRDAALKQALGIEDDGANMEASGPDPAEAEALERQRQAEAEAAAAAAEQARQEAAAAAARKAAADAEAAAAADAADQEETGRAQQEEQQRQQEAFEEEMRRRAEEEAASAQPSMPPQPNFPGGEDDDGGMPPPPQMEPRRQQLPARPTTARRPPPKLPSKEVKVERRERPGRGQAAEPVEQPKVIGLISEGADDDEEEEEEEVAAPTLPGWDLGEKDGDEVVEGEQHGSLVAGIMKDKQKAAAEGGAQDAAGEAPQEGIIIIKKDKRRGSLSSSQGQRKPKQSDNDIHKLRQSIQQLCQSTTPLGKCVEGVQADLEHMEREFRMWKAEGMANARKLEHTSNSTESALQPLQGLIDEEQIKIKDMKLQIDRVKANVMQNNMTIHSLLRGVVAGHRN